MCVILKPITSNQSGKSDIVGSTVFSHSVWEWPSQITPLLDSIPRADFQLRSDTLPLEVINKALHQGLNTGEINKMFLTWFMLFSQY